MRVEINTAGFRELRTSDAAKGLLYEHARRIAAQADRVPSTTQPAATEPYYGIEDGSDAERARLRICTTGARAAKHEAKTQALQKSL